MRGVALVMGVKAVGKVRGREVGLQFKKGLPSALVAPSVLCAQGLSTRTGAADLRPAWVGKTVMAAMSNCRVPAWR